MEIKRALTAIALTAGLMGSIPAAAGEAVQTLEKLYEELQEFKDAPEFRHVGFGRCCKYFTWHERVRALNGKASVQEFLKGMGVVPGDLILLGWAYANGQGAGEYARFIEGEIRRARQGYTEPTWQAPAGPAWINVGIPPRYAWSGTGTSRGEKTGWRIIYSCLVDAKIHIQHEGRDFPGTAREWTLSARWDGAEEVPPYRVDVDRRGNLEVQDQDMRRMRTRIERHDDVEMRMPNGAEVRFSLTKSKRTIARANEGCPKA